MMPLRPLLKNKLLLQKHYHVQEESLDCWPFWMLEENISIINEISDEEDKQRKKDEETQQKSMPNFNPSSYMNNMNNMMNNFK
jgi:hypothetical protein